LVETLVGLKYDGVFPLLPGVFTALDFLDFTPDLGEDICLGVVFKKALDGEPALNVL
jgi:hypothetical protein